MRFGIRVRCISLSSALMGQLMRPISDQACTRVRSSYTTWLLRDLVQRWPRMRRFEVRPYILNGRGRFSASASKHFPSFFLAGTIYSAADSQLTLDFRINKKMGDKDGGIYNSLSLFFSAWSLLKAFLLHALLSLIINNVLSCRLIALCPFYFIEWVSQVLKQVIIETDLFNVFVLWAYWLPRWIKKLVSSSYKIKTIKSSKTIF